jgi:hypothetical protein
LSGQKKRGGLLDFNIQQEEIRPKISPARIHNDITNLPRVIEVVRAQHPKRPLMELSRGNRPSTSETDAKLKPPRR